MGGRDRYRDDEDRRDWRRSRSRSRSRDREDFAQAPAAPAGVPAGIGSTITPPAVTADAFGRMVVPGAPAAAVPGAQGTAMPGMVPMMMVPAAGAVAGAAAIPGVVPGAAAPLMVSPAVADAQDKVNRELFVGNTPPGTSEALLMAFLNGAMRRTKLCAADASPIIQCRTNQKFAFVECASIQEANLALNLNGIPFMGSSLRVSRPSKYAGPHVPSKTWQELTGQALPAGLTPVPENSSPAEDKVNRELFIGNTTPEMTESMLTDFLGKAMEQVGLSTQPGNPITACRVSGKFAFIELRSKEEAANALNLNNIPYLGAQLRVGRPSKYTGPQTSHGNWEDILAKYMSGELKLPSQGGAPAAAAAPAADAGTPTRVVELKNMLTKEELASDQDYEEIMEDTKEECSQFGSLKNLVIPRDGPGATKIFLEYLSTDDAAKAIKGLAGRTFDGRKVEAIFYDETKFANKDY